VVKLESAFEIIDVDDGSL